ncbi:MAG: 30S ribosomal protein S15 [Planctomycetes bacterium]|nr:30S ribosomal protein S15 [Planctomycetota bacterium]
MATPAASKTKLIQDFRIGEQDTGSPEVQIALLSDRIKSLTEHFKSHKNDFAGRRGLLMMVGRRNTLLKFLKNKSSQRHEALVKRLGLRSS